MTRILTTALIAVTAIAHPNPTNPLVPRDFPQPVGKNSQGLDFENGLEFKIYERKNCEGSPAGVYTGNYGFYEAYQMQSYHLSRPLEGNETLDFYAGLEPVVGVNNTFDPTLNGQSTMSCLMYDATAGRNATEDDKAADQAEHLGKDKGCHTLNKNEWCAVIWTE